MSDFRPVLLVPHYNHVEAFARYLPDLLGVGVPVLVVDDGSDPGQRERLETLAVEQDFDLLCRPRNAGKGDAVMAGLEYAAHQGYTHALQIDADGQHETADIPRFLAVARERPRTMICGVPVFGDDAPWVRVWGRKLTDGMVFLETWSRGIRDSLCGFRVYPLAQTLTVVAIKRPGRRMDFDADMLVRARWEGMDLHFLDTRVRYPEHGVSHFHYLRDNLRMVGLHVRLLLGMLVRAPGLLKLRATGRLGKVTGEHGLE